MATKSKFNKKMGHAFFFKFSTIKTCLIGISMGTIFSISTIKLFVNGINIVTTTWLCTKVLDIIFTLKYFKWMKYMIWCLMWFEVETEWTSCLPYIKLIYFWLSNGDGYCKVSFLTVFLMWKVFLVSVIGRTILTKKFKRGKLVSFFTPMLTICGSGHFDGHVWRRVVAPSDLTICAHYRCRVFYCAITYMRAWFNSTQERQLMQNEISWRAYSYE